MGAANGVLSSSLLLPTQTNLSSRPSSSPSSSPLSTTTTTTTTPLHQLLLHPSSFILPLPLQSSSTSPLASSPPTGLLNNRSLSLYREPGDETCKSLDASHSCGYGMVSHSFNCPAKWPRFAILSVASSINQVDILPVVDVGTCERRSRVHNAPSTKILGGPCKEIASDILLGERILIQRDPLSHRAFTWSPPIDENDRTRRRQYSRCDSKGNPSVSIRELRQALTG